MLGIESLRSTGTAMLGYCLDLVSWVPPLTRPCGRERMLLRRRARALVFANSEDAPGRPLGSRRRDRADVLGRRRRVARTLDPPAAEELVEVDQIGQARHARLHQRELGTIQTGLRGKDGEVIVHAVLEPKLGQVERALLGGGETFQ